MIYKRGGLTLSALFPKPRPIWSTPVFVALFGDAFIEGSTLEGSSLMPWSFAILNFSIQRMLKDQSKETAYGKSITDASWNALSDVARIFAISASIFKKMQRLIKFPNSSQLLTFLRRLKKWVDNLTVGETILLPLLVEKKELLIIVTRKTGQAYKFVLVNTDPLAGLAYHPVSSSITTKKLKYKTCLVFDNIPKQQALCEVFLSSLYNLTIHNHKFDTDKFYDILIPFLTGKTVGIFFS